MITRRKNKNAENRAYQFRLYPTEKQEVLLSKTFGCSRKIYNLML
ncbi:MAG: helix-turn-helix domain-containing protein, partial [Synergistaceae bacterium]|nr:helix-turn-helix domain-containing protein [Synergistaceae bacterium]